jgi:hypothetical protein
MKKFVGCLLLLSALVSSCKKVQPEMNPQYEGCECAKEVSADFSINEVAAYNIPNLEFITETDTIYADRTVRFIAKEENAEYTWIIGAETLNTKVVDRSFPIALGGQDISITLIVKKKPNSICLPNDDGLDTITKTFYVSNYTSDVLNLNIPTLMEGIYRVKDEQSLDSVNISVDYFYENSQSTGNGVRITNHKGTNETIQTADLLSNYREFYTTSKLVGKFKYKLNGEVEFKCEDRTVDPYRQYNFKGRKL